MPSASAPAAAPRARPRPAVEVADIFRAHGAAYRHTHPLSRAQRHAMQARTIAADDSWIAGPPYTLSEEVFDEHSLDACSLSPNADDN